MKCPNCAATLKNNPKFCPYCGSDLREIKEDKKEVVFDEQEIEEKTHKKETEKNPQKKTGETNPYQRKTDSKPVKKKIKIKWILLAIIPLVIATVVFLFLNNKNATYVTAMDNGIEAVNSEEYDTALTYFEEALTEKKNDGKAKRWSQNTAILKEANELYSNYEFDQAVIEVNNILHADIDEDDLTILFEKAEELKTKIVKIIAEQTDFDADLHEAQTMFDAVDADEQAVQNIIKKLEQILAHDEINKKYHADVKKDTEILLSDVKTYEERLIEHQAIAVEKEKAEVLAEESDEAIKQALSEYSAKEIEYARIILMDGYPNGSTIYISEGPAGRAIASPYDETVKYPDKTVTLTGSYGTDGMTVYSPIGGGYITVYPVPMRWHQDDQSPEGYREYTQQILDDALRVYIDPGNPAELLEKLRTTEFIQSN